MVEHLAREVPSLFVGSGPHEDGGGDQALPPGATPPVQEGTTPTLGSPATAPRDSGSGFRAARVHRYAWWVSGGGAVLAAASGVFYVLAQGKQDEVDGAPVGSLEDFHHLQALEDEGARDATVGNVLLVAGGAALVTGVALVLYQGYARPPGETTGASGNLSLRPVVTPGVAGLALELTWP
jgi:hypothetical protein